MHGHRGNARIRGQQQHGNLNDRVAPHGAHDRFGLRPPRGRANNRAPRRNSMPQINRLSQSYIGRGAHSRPSLPRRQSRSVPLYHHRSSSSGTADNQRPHTAPSHPTDEGRPFLRDIHNPKYRSKIRALIFEGSLLSQQLQKFLQEIELVLKSDPEEMDWDLTRGPDALKDETSRQEWAEIKPEVKDPFEKLVAETQRTTLAAYERRDGSQQTVNGGWDVEGSQKPKDGSVS